MTIRAASGTIDEMGAIPAGDGKPVTRAQWSAAARRRGMQRLLGAVDSNHQMRRRLEEAEDLIARAGEDYRRSQLTGAALSPPSPIQTIAETIQLDDPEEPPPARGA